jgi:hypothetical protein
MKRLVEKLARRIGIAVGLVFLWLIYVEIASFARLRLAHTDTDVIPRDHLQSVYTGATWVNTLADEWEPSNKVDYEAYVGWQRRPFEGQTIRIDAAGVRRSFHSHCDDKEYTIWMFGGSTVWGAGTPDWLTIPSLLAEKYEQGGRNVCMRNYGEKAWVSTQEVIKLMLELKKNERKPDLVIFYDGPADVYESYQSGRAGLHQNFDETKHFLEGHASAGAGNFRYFSETNTARLFGQQRWQSRIERWITQKDTGSIARETIRCYLGNVQLVQALGREYGFEPVFFWEPRISTGKKQLTPLEEAARDAARQRTPGMEEANQAAYALIKAECRAPMYCIADAFDGETGTVYFDDAHIDATGNQLIAARMYNTISAGMKPVH